jgi:hypothetical protein
MARHARPRRTGPVLALLAGSALFALPGAAALSSGRDADPGLGQLSGITRAASSAAQPVADVPPPRAEPQRLVIDAVGIKADVEFVGLAADGSLAPPVNVARTGWFAQSSRPGELGPSVFVGHLDSVDGPAVFARLGELKVGDVVKVEAVDGSSVSYVVSSVDRYPKESFPSEAVYGGTPEPSLRLITCGGPYQRGTGYSDNVVVTARAEGG